MLWKLLSSLPPEVREDVAALAIDGTSATALLVDMGSGRALLPAKLYNEAQGSEAVAAAKVGWEGGERERCVRQGDIGLGLGLGGRKGETGGCVRQGSMGQGLVSGQTYPQCSSYPSSQVMAPPAHTATASTSTLCKLLTWHQAGAWQKEEAAGRRPCLMHQADWLAALLHGDR